MGIKIRFTEDRILTDETGAIAESYKAGQVIVLPNDKSMRWLRRNAAVEVHDEPSAAAKPKTPEKPKETAAPPAELPLAAEKPDAFGVGDMPKPPEPVPEPPQAPGKRRFGR